MNNLTALDLLALYLKPFLYDVYIHRSDGGECYFSFHLLGKPFFSSKHFSKKEECVNAISQILSDTIEMGELLTMAYPRLVSLQVFREFSVEQRDIVSPDVMDLSLQQKIIASLKETWGASMSTIKWREKNIA